MGAQRERLFAARESFPARFLRSYIRRDRRRVHPNESARNRIVYLQLETALAYVAKKYARGRLIDIGCGLKPWEALFSPFVTEYIGVDYAESVHGQARVDIVATAYEVPLEGGCAETVLLNEVLEHLERPRDALAECFRLLRRGGHVIIDTPFIWHVHEAPRDFYRYSPYGLRYLLESVGFEVVEVRPLSGGWTMLATELSYMLQRYRRRGTGPLIDGLSLSAQWLASRWETIDFQPAFSWGHLAVARR